MIKAWSEVVRHYEGCTWDSLQAIQSLSQRIHEGPLGEHLYPWTSMHDLCVSQIHQTYPPVGPYLKISAMNAHEVEFRYMDTGILEKQWHRTVPSEDVLERFQRFIEQLHWAAYPKEAS